MTKSSFKTRKYLSIPYKWNGDTEAGCDCYGLISLIYRNELGISLKQFKIYDTYKDMEETVFVDHANDEFVRVDSLEPYDVILLYNGKKYPNHVGLYIGAGKMIHITHRTKMPVVERVEAWREKIHSLYRHRE